MDNNKIDIKLNNQKRLDSGNSNINKKGNENDDKKYPVDKKLIIISKPK